MNNQPRKFRRLDLKKVPETLYEKHLVQEDEYLRSEQFTGYDDRSCMKFQWEKE